MNLPFYTILKKRIIRTPSANLSERIILQARYLPQRSSSMSDMITEFFYHDIALPRPLFKFMSILVLGVMMGLSTIHTMPSLFTSHKKLFLLDQDDTLFPGLGDIYE